MSSPPPCTQWWEALRADPMGWLLDEDHPGIVWKALTDLVRRPVDAPAVTRARGAADASEPLATILEPLDPGGRWNIAGGPWDGPESGGWRLVAAAQLGADPRDPRLDAAASHLATAGLPRDPGSPCTAARAAEALALLGWGNSPVMTELLAWLEEAVPRAEDGGWRCTEPSHAASGGGCAVTAAGILSALSVPGARRRPPMAERARDSLLQFLAANASRAGRMGWPNLMRISRIEALLRLALAGVPWDPRMLHVLRELHGSQDAGGRWPAQLPPEASWSGAPGLDQPGRPSRWLTLHALIILRAYAVPAGLARLYPERPGTAN